MEAHIEITHRARAQRKIDYERKIPSIESYIIIERSICIAISFSSHKTSQVILVTHIVTKIWRTSATVAHSDKCTCANGIYYYEYGAGFEVSFSSE